MDARVYPALILPHAHGLSAHCTAQRQSPPTGIRTPISTRRPIQPACSFSCPAGCQPPEQPLGAAPERPQRVRCLSCQPAGRSEQHTRQPRSASALRQLAHMRGCAKLASGVLSCCSPLLCIGPTLKLPALFDITYLPVDSAVPTLKPARATQHKLPPFPRLSYPF